MHPENLTQSSLDGQAATVSSSSRNFYIFGHNISHSLSPALHNAGFRALKLPHHFSIHQTPQVDATVADLIVRPDFGGAAVTFPHKLQVGRLLASLSPSAERVGAVNTIVVGEADGQRVLVGDNTDWLGIKACIEKSGITGFRDAPGLVVGAGGAARAACYALQVLGVPEIIVVNRTKSRAEAMAESFSGTKFRVFENLDDLTAGVEESMCLVVACVPADDLAEEKIPRAIFEKARAGVLVEMAYRPQETGMMKVARACSGWDVFRGTDVLEEQAYAQFELWTGQNAPAALMREAMLAEINSRL